MTVRRCARCAEIYDAADADPPHVCPTAAETAARNALVADAAAAVEHFDQDELEHFARTQRMTLPTLEIRRTGVPPRLVQLGDLPVRGLFRLPEEPAGVYLVAADLTTGDRRGINLRTGKIVMFGAYVSVVPLSGELFVGPAPEPA